jgi:formylmethanofuran:tetrahydromethanopterin formyltransferase
VSARALVFHGVLVAAGVAPAHDGAPSLQLGRDICHGALEVVMQERIAEQLAQDVATAGWTAVYERLTGEHDQTAAVHNVSFAVFQAYSVFYSVFGALEVVMQERIAEQLAQDVATAGWTAVYERLTGKRRSQNFVTQSLVISICAEHNTVFSVYHFAASCCSNGGGYR